MYLLIYLHWNMHLCHSNLVCSLFNVSFQLIADNKAWAINGNYCYFRKGHRIQKSLFVDDFGYYSFYYAALFMFITLKINRNVKK